MGLVSCLGLDAERTWAEVRRGRCGLGPLKSLESRLEPDKGGGEAPELPEGFPAGESREVAYLRRALREAVGQSMGAGSGLSTAPRVGIVMGTTLHGMRRGGEFLRSGDLGALRGFLGPAVLRQQVALADRVPVTTLIESAANELPAPDAGKRDQRRERVMRALESLVAGGAVSVAGGFVSVEP